MAESVSFLLRNARNDQLTEGIVLFFFCPSLNWIACLTAGIVPPLLD